ncbi:MAG: inositol monophosphatase [Intrasporangium sp.]|uniref:inositol monophosphatase family protein n=1 Tax=Intrasporangium sp. TaxID=1925024 RepID=UPI002649BD1E|nr:inositol monophosphatase family protein [Intrasporangium sp.]MDN5798253.1 inositol monophosphatase [Intrasporangium sp.]
MAHLDHDLDPALLVELEHLCTGLASHAGRFIHDERPRRVRVADTKSSETDVVTEMDRRSEQLLHGLVRQARPEDGILGEEGAHVSGRSGLTWVIDPIDGTVNYLYDIPAYAVSVAVVVGDPETPGSWRPVAGAVSDPCRGVVHHARRGGGAWTRSDHGKRSVPRRLAVSTEDALGRALLATGFGYEAQVRARQAEVMREVLPLVRDIRRIGSAALDLARVAEGTVDAYAETGLNPWDLAAGWLLVEEAGGQVLGVAAHPGPALTVAAGPALVEPVRALFTARMHSEGDVS